MRKQLLATAAAVALTTAFYGPALAADMPVKAVAPVPFYNWTGWYAGVHAGGGWLRMTNDTSTFRGDGFIGGAQLGYNWQTGNIVFGIEGDVSGAGLKAKGLTSSALRVDLLASLRGRLGIAFDKVLVYATGGGALIHGRASCSAGCGITNNFTYFGGVVGGGLEYAIAPNWTVRGEGLYYLVDKTDTLAVGEFAKVNNIWIARAALNFRF